MDEALFIRKTLVVKRAFLILYQYVFKSKSYKKRSIR